jgi:hypothetical protein
MDEKTTAAPVATSDNLAEAIITREIDTLIDLLGLDGAALMLRNMLQILLGEKFGTATRNLAGKVPGVN